jgi:hypothetical protein
VREERVEVLALYEAGVSAVEQSTASLTAAEWQRSACGAWTATDLAGHLICVAGWYHAWLDRAEAGDAAPPFTAADLAARNDAALSTLEPECGEERRRERRTADRHLSHNERGSGNLRAMSDERMALPSAADVLREQLRYAWLSSRWLLEDLDDDEYFWEPTSLCWSVRRRAPDVRGWGNGEFVCEDAFPAPEPLPATTIGWRVTHLAAWTDIYRHWTFGDERPTLRDADVPGQAAAGVAWLYEAQDRFMRAVEALDDEAVFELRPAHWGESLPAVQLVTTMLIEHVHHLGEIGVLRDLHRGNARTRPRFGDA